MNKVILVGRLTRDSEIKKMVRWTQDFNDLLDEAYEYINKR